MFINMLDNPMVLLEAYFERFAAHKIRKELLLNENMIKNTYEIRSILLVSFSPRKVMVIWLNSVITTSSGPLGAHFC
jgi:hypothetical protein